MSYGAKQQKKGNSQGNFLDADLKSKVEISLQLINFESLD